MQLEALAKAAKGILNWEQPILTFGLWMAILLIAWRDLLPYSIAMLFFAQVGLLLVFGSWTAFGHEDAVLVGGRQAPSGQRLTILGRLRKFHDTLGSTQHRLHKMNTALLKVRRCCFVGVWGLGGVGCVFTPCLLCQFVHVERPPAHAPFLVRPACAGSVAVCASTADTVHWVGFHDVHALFPQAWWHGDNGSAAVH